MYKKTNISKIKHVEKKEKLYFSLMKHNADLITRVEEISDQKNQILREKDDLFSQIAGHIEVQQAYMETLTLNKNLQEQLRKFEAKSLKKDKKRKVRFATAPEIV